MNILILVDWQNLFKTCEGKFHLDKVVEEIIRRALERGVLQEIRLFIPNYQLIAGPWKLINRLQLKYGLAVSICPCLREGAENGEGYKDLVDFEVLRWITKYLHPGTPPELVVFVSGDGHFLVAANEAKTRGKEVEFWIVNPETTSGAILGFQTFREIKIPGEPIFAEEEENAFIATLDKIQKGGETDEADKQRLSFLRKASEILAVIEEPFTLEKKIQEVNQELQQRLGISEKEAKEILKALMVLGAARIYPVASVGLTIDSTSLFLEWLRRKTEP